MKKRVAILTGGTSSEREIALESATAVKDALGGRFEILFYDLPNDLDKFLFDRSSIDVAVPVFHGRGGEGGAIQGFLETLGIPYIFSGIQALAVALNKQLAKIAVSNTGVRVPAGRIITDKKLISYQVPVVVKPVDSGSSIGVSIVKDERDLGAALDAAFNESQSVLVEDFIEGDEYSVLVAETKDGVKTFPVIAIKPKAGFFDYETKYDSTLVDEICPAPISDELSGALQAMALKAHQTIGARHISRSDFIVDKDGKIWFLEINTIPGVTFNSLAPKALKVAGVDFGDLLASWIDSL